MSEGYMSAFAIYDHPSDYPNHFVVRRWNVVDDIPVPLPEDNPVLVESLQAARDALPAGLNNIGRRLGDNPVIVEVWI